MKKYLQKGLHLPLKLRTINPVGCMGRCMACIAPEMEEANRSESTGKTIRGHSVKW